LAIALRQIVSRSRGLLSFSLRGGDLVEDHHLGAAEGQFAGEEFIEDDAQTIDITSTVGLVALAGRLFRAHICRRPQNMAIQGQRHLRLAP
jgi:hypothetical protein